MSKTLAAILAEIAANFPDNTTGLITPALTRSALTDITSSGRTFLNVMDYGAKGDGVTDDSASINSALAALSAAGGGTLYFPPGNYLMSTSTLIPPSNSIIQGAGRDITTITNTSTAGGQDAVITVLMTMTGGTNAGTWVANNTTYPINAPVLGANTVTTTTASNAGNFAPGNIIMLGGDPKGTAFWYPSWYTTVVSVNAGTGVITLAETVPLAGTANFSTVQKIISLPKNIVVRDMTLSVNSNIGGFSGAIMEILGCESFLAENLKFVNASGTQGAGLAIGAPCRRSGFRNCYAGPVAGPMELFGCHESFIEGCSTFQSGLLIDGGSTDCTVINNHIKDPQENGAGFFGIYIPSYTQRITVIGNTVVGIPSTFAGIATVDTPDANRFISMSGNILVGANTTNTTGINATKGSYSGNYFQNLQNGIVFESVADCILEGNYFEPSVTTPISTFSGTGIYRTRQNTPMQAMAGGVGSPTVQGGQNYTLTQGGAQNVTSFTGGLGGDEITIILQDANTTFVNGGNLKMKSGVNYNPASGVVMCFICNFSGTWSEKSRSQ